MAEARNDAYLTTFMRNWDAAMLGAMLKYWTYSCFFVILLFFIDLFSIFELITILSVNYGNHILLMTHSGRCTTRLILKSLYLIYYLGLLFGHGIFLACILICSSTVCTPFSGLQCLPVVSGLQCVLYYFFCTFPHIVFCSYLSLTQTVFFPVNTYITLCAISLGSVFLFSLKLVSAISVNFYFFHQMIILQNLWKMLFISSEKLFLFWRYSNFCVSIFPFFSPCWSLL